jgi:hypothetical protein
LSGPKHDPAGTEFVPIRHLPRGKGERKTMKFNGSRKPVRRSITAKWISRNRLAVEWQADSQFAVRRRYVGKALRELEKHRRMTLFTSSKL